MTREVRRVEQSRTDQRAGSKPDRCAAKGGRRASKPDGTIQMLAASIRMLAAVIQMLAASIQMLAASIQMLAASILVQGMESERLYVQSLADKDAARAVEIIQNAGLVVAGRSGHGKLMLVLRDGPTPGSVEADANVGLLVADAPHPYATRFFNWEITSDGGRTFVPAPSTNHCKTVLTGLTPLTVVGVRVSVTILGVTGPWTDVATTLVR
jgi:hypothetical protein